MSRFHIIKDTREKDGHGWWFEENQYCSGTTKTKVNIGDYTIEWKLLREEILDRNG